MEKNVATIKNILLVFLAFLVIYMISVLSSLLIPLAMALFIAILLQPILARFEKMRWPFSLSLTAISITTLSFLWLFGMLIYRTGKSIAVQKEKLLGQINSKLELILGWANSLPGVDIQADNITTLLSDLMTYDWLLKSSGQFAGLLGNFTGSFFMTALYLIALLGGILRYEQYINYLEDGKPETQEELLRGFEQVKSSIVTYMKVKFFMSLLTGMGYFVVCLLFGIDFALFWGFLGFVLNFIPTFGSIIATLPPLLLGLVQLDSFYSVVFLLLCLALIQNIFGNVFEPKMMGSSLKLNTITVILGLLFWGYLWGVAGMILSVPLVVLMKVILNRFPDAQFMVRLMSGSKIGEN